MNLVGGMFSQNMYLLTDQATSLFSPISLGVLRLQRLFAVVIGPHSSRIYGAFSGALRLEQVVRVEGTARRGWRGQRGCRYFMTLDVCGALFFHVPLVEGRVHQYLW